jgi:AcrR family transcriptional regulator
MKIKNKIPWLELSKLPDSKKLGKRKIQILDASLKILATVGIQELSITRISKETSLSKSLILYHFDTKTKILEELYFFNNKILSYLIDKYDNSEQRFEMRIANMLLAMQQWTFFNDEISELILLMFYESNKSPRLKNLFEQNKQMLKLRFERIFLESMRYKTLEEVRIATSGVQSLISGTLIAAIREDNVQDLEDSLFHLRMNIETLLKVEVPAIELKAASLVTPLSSFNI